MKIELEVLGMSCHHCVEKIERFVRQVEGVKSVQADLKAKLVRVECADHTSKKAIQEAILDSGFELA